MNYKVCDCILCSFKFEKAPTQEEWDRFHARGYKFTYPTMLIKPDTLEPLRPRCFHEAASWYPCAGCKYEKLKHGFTHGIVEEGADVIRCDC